MFKGRVPITSNSTIDPSNATVATNCRLRSGDLEAYRGIDSIITLDKAGVTNTIYPMDRSNKAGGPFWLNWPAIQVAPNTTKIDVVRGNLLQDTTERTFYTSATDLPLTGGLYRPKFTNIAMATGASVKDTGSPHDWRLLGVPAPGPSAPVPNTGLIVTQTLNMANLTPAVISDGSSLTGWTLAPQVVAKSTVTVDAVHGNPVPSFDILMVHPAGVGDPTSSFLYKDIGMLTGPGSFKIDIEARTAGTNGYLNLFLGVDSNGENGLLASIPYGNGGGNTLVFFNANGWGNAGGSTAGGGFFGGATNPNSPIAVNTFYTLQFDYLNVNGQLDEYNFKVSLFNGVTLISTVNINNVNVQGNTFFGAQALSGLNPPTIDFQVDNILLTQIQLLNNPAYEATSWTYTFVDDFGQEGAPAPSSLVYFIGPGLTTTLSNFDQGTAAIAAGYAIASINLYRAVTGSTSTQFQFEINLPLSTVTYVDTLSDTQLGEVLQTDIYDLPPDDARHITNLPNGITIIASSNQICPSVQYRPYAYPVEYRLATDFPVVAIIGMETMAIVLTEESAYLVIGSDPSAMSMSKITPEYGCVSKRSVVRWGNYGAVYASNQGLVTVGTYGANLVTSTFISQREWTAQYSPFAIEGAIHEDMYYGFFPNALGPLKGFIFDIKTEGVGFIDLTTTSNATYSEHLQELLYLTQGNTLFLWDADPVLQTYTWRSKLWQNGYPTAFHCGLIRAVPPDIHTGTVTLNLYDSTGNSPYYTHTYTSDMEFLVPPNASFDTQYELVGNAAVSNIQIAEDMMELQ